MPFISDYVKLNRDHAQNPRYVLDGPIKSLTMEIEKGLNGGIVDPAYLQSKLDIIQQHIDWLKYHAD